MTFDFTEEHTALRRSVRELLDDHAGEQAIRATAETQLGLDRELWKLLTQQLGLTGLAVPEEYGGAGAGPVELAIVMEEMGKSLYTGPFLGSAVLATTLLTELGATEYLPELVDGTRVATVALAEDGAGWDPTGMRTTARSSGDGWALTGTKRYVLDGALADLLLVVTGEAEVYAVDPAANGVTIIPSTTLDATRKLATITFDDADAARLGEGARAAVDRTLRTAEIMLAAEQAGGARAVLDMSVAYAKQRFQFGRAIGSFQAIKHLCADTLVNVESAYSAAYYAAWALADESQELPAVAGMAQAFCAETFERAAADNIQIHGGIGFTAEHPAHLYLRRARADRELFGDPATHRERYLTTIAT